ncbi:CdiA family toxin C-terminal domain-containing protein [Lachnobacterium bovis]|nr:CdiA family toxin C-terminal domain-containing protein [Lachnobacterium bovis]
MASIYHRGKSWTQIAEDWLFDHKGEIVTFCKSFAIAFLTTCTLIVIATAISVSVPVMFMVFGILVAAGQCTISCMPQSAFEAKWLKGIKDSSDSYVDGLNEKWKAFSDRGIYGVLECIGQDIGDASQTGKGLASITGSITGSIAGGFAGDKLSLKVKKAKAAKAKAKAKSLKISETKEPELKDVEGEKPKVSKGEEKPIGPKAKLEKVKFKEGRYEHHMSYAEKFTDQGGASGGHNLKNFKEGIANSKYTLDHYKAIKHPDIDGVYDIEYTLKRPVKDYTGKPIPGEFKHVPGGKRIFKKTVYDPNVISDNEMIKLSKDAMKEAVKSGRKRVMDKQNKVLYQGKVSYKGKTLKFEGFENMNTGEIENAYPVLEWSSN